MPDMKKPHLLEQEHSRLDRKELPHSNGKLGTEGSERDSILMATHADQRQSTWESHPSNPFNWPGPKKWQLFLLGSLITLLVGLNSTAISTPSVDIAEHFGIGASNPNIDSTVWPITAWNTGAAFGPMVGLPLLEAFGIRIGYLATYAVFFLFVIPQALAPNFATMIVTRIIAGTAGGVLMNALENFIADIWLTEPERDLPITLYVLVYLGGVTLGPAFGAISSVLYWRWVFYIQLIIYGALFPGLLLIIKETRGPVILSRLTKANPDLFQVNSRDAFHRSASRATARSAVATSLKTLLYDAIVRPARMLFTEPVIFSFTLWSAFCFGLVYICIQSITQIYQANYAFTGGQCGLILLAPFIGILLGGIACVPQNIYYQRSTKRNHGIPIPEARLPLSVAASLLGLSGGLFWYAWASQPHLPWILPTIGLGVVGFSVQIIVTAAALYVTDSYSKFAGSAIANVAFGENVMAAWLPLATRRMYNVLGFQWASSLLGFAALALTIGPLYLMVCGKKVRDRSPFIREARYVEDEG